MGITLDQQALVALVDDDFVTTRGYCQKFVRQCIQHLYGDRFDEFHKADAKLSFYAWRESEWFVMPHRGSVPGDILYYVGPGHGPHGHVAIRLKGNKVAENSIVHQNGKYGGKGIRKLDTVGYPVGVIRLPPA